MRRELTDNADKMNSPESQILDSVVRFHSLMMVSLFDGPIRVLLFSVHTGTANILSFRKATSTDCLSATKFTPFLVTSSVSWRVLSSRFMRSLKHIIHIFIADLVPRYGPVLWDILFHISKIPSLGTS